MMRTRTVVLLLALAVGGAGCSATGKSSKAPASDMTCEDFLGMSEDVQPRAIAWVDGYSKGKLTSQDVGAVYVDRQTEVLVVACKQNPKETLWDKIKMHLPGGSKQVKPTKMTCQEFVDLDQTVRPELVYWADGYNRATKMQEGAAAQVDLDRNVAIVYEECKQAPTESFWAKMKQHF